MKIEIGGRKLLVLGSTTLVLLLGLAIAIVGHSPQSITAIAGGLLLAVSFIVMAPCQLQMAASLTVVMKNVEAQKPQKTSAGLVRMTAISFALGYLTFYLLIAISTGILAWLLGRYAWTLMVAGGAMAVVLGLSALGMLPEQWLAECPGPWWLIRSRRASFQQPFRAGLAFGQHCASCCGPYIYALVVVAGATATLWPGSGLVMTYAMLMVIPFLLPAFLSPAIYAVVSGRLQDLTPRLGRARAYVLVGLGILLIPVSVLIAGR